MYDYGPSEAWPAGLMTAFAVTGGKDHYCTGPGRYIRAPRPPERIGAAGRPGAGRTHTATGRVTS